MKDQRSDRGRQVRGQPLLDLDADDPGRPAHVEVLVLEVSQAVGEVDHGAVRQPDVELLHVEVDVELEER